MVAVADCRSFAASAKSVFLAKSLTEVRSGGTGRVSSFCPAATKPFGVAGLSNAIGFGLQDQENSRHTPSVLPATSGVVPCVAATDPDGWFEHALLLREPTRMFCN